jgi:CRISPR-associated exonuclease Cas4
MNFLLVVILILAAFFLFWQSSRQRKATGLPSGRVIYTDTRQWGKLEKPLYDPISGLTGKPDYLVEQQGFSIPVEVKSAYAPAQPYPSHVYQLAAYCLLVERTTGKRPPYGILHYRNRDFALDYTPELEADLQQTLQAIRLQDRSGAADRSHDEPARCARCGYRAVCDQRL